jgi:hypothetical protein
MRCVLGEDDGKRFWEQKIAFSVSGLLVVVEKLKSAGIRVFGLTET